MCSGRFVNDANGHVGDSEITAMAHAKNEKRPFEKDRNRRPSASETGRLCWERDPKAAGAVRGTVQIKAENRNEIILP